MLPFTLSGLLLTSCGVIVADTGPNYAETDRQSETLATAISFPRQEDAAGFARAVLNTNLGRQTGTFSVLEATDLAHRGPQDPMARLVWRIHHDAVDAGWGAHRDAWDACYVVEFNYYGPTTGPERIDCPPDATPVTPPPTPHREIPQTAGPALQAVLTALPPTVTEADVRAAVTAGLPAPVVDEETGLAAIPPDVLVTVRGADVGVALFARTGAESKDCVLGHRVAGVVAVWSPGLRDLEFKEGVCTAEAALATA
jgi:hypothetical protein